MAVIVTATTTPSLVSSLNHSEMEVACRKTLFAKKCCRMKVQDLIGMITKEIIEAMRAASASSFIRRPTLDQSA
jgi:hypothetical protein